MTVVLKVGNREIEAERLLQVLAGYQMLPQLLRELVLDEAIAQWEQSLGQAVMTEEEAAASREQFFAQQRIDSQEALQRWMAQHGISLEQLGPLATRSLRVEKFKEATWGPKLESYFLGRKGQLDKVIYSLIRTQDMGIGQEIYFRVLEEEQSFAELARTYSQGPEAQTDGLIGPVELSVPHPTLAQMLSVSQPGQLWPPTRIGEWMVVVRLERFIPAQMDESMRRRLLNELFTAWIDEQTAQLAATMPWAPNEPDAAPQDAAPSLPNPPASSAHQSAEMSHATAPHSGSES